MTHEPETDALSTSQSADVAIVEGRILEYRRRFFERLAAALAEESVSLSVIVDTEPFDLFETKGGGSTVSVQRVSASTVTVAGRQLTLRAISEATRNSELVVVDQGLRHLENYLLLRRQRRGPKVALWGHGTRFVKSATRVERAIERRALMSAHWFFAYTQRGADHVSAAGFPRDRVSVVHNTFDVEELARLRESLSPDEASSLRRELELEGDNVCLFIGELDAPKRIPFLLEACSAVARHVPDFALLIAGDGKERDRVDAWSATHPWVRYVGRASDRDKARLGAISKILLMPGRVGLVAVDSFALATPIVTTRWPYHAPEIDYLDDGVNARFADDDVADFAHAVHSLLTDRHELERLRAGCVTARGHYSLDRMVGSFAEGVARALRTDRRR